LSETTDLEKSSIVEAMETFQSVVLNGLDEAMIPWHGFEYIWNKAKEHKTIKGKISNPMTFVFRGKSQVGCISCTTTGIRIIE